MAASFICDGCGTPVEKPKKIGYSLSRDYCKACKKIARTFLALEEEERLHFHRRFLEVRHNLIKLHSQDGKFKLPDVP